MGNTSFPPLKRHPASYYEAFVTVRVTYEAADTIGLCNPNILRIDNIQWIRENSKYNSYLYYICELLFDTTELSLSRTQDGRDDKDESSEWVRITHEEEIQGGIYLLQLDSNLTHDLSSY